MCFPVDDIQDEKVFVLEVYSDQREYTYYIPMQSALELATTSPNTVYILDGKYRYHYYNGEPLLSIIESSDTLNNKHWRNDYESSFEG